MFVLLYTGGGYCSRGCILLRDGFFFFGGGGWGRVRYGHRWWVYSAGGRSDAHFLCMYSGMNVRIMYESSTTSNVVGLSVRHNNTRIHVRVRQEVSYR